MAPKPKTVRAIHSNRGVESRYRRALEELIKEMSNSAEYWLAAQYRKAPPEIAEDALPAAEMAARHAHHAEEEQPVRGHGVAGAVLDQTAGR